VLLRNLAVESLFFPPFPTVYFQLLSSEGKRTAVLADLLSFF